MKNLKPFLVVGGLGVIFYALYRYYNQQVSFLKDITYQVKGLRVKSFKKNAVSLDITAQIYNASNVEAVVKEIYLDAFVNGIKVGNVNEVKDIQILPSQSSIISFNFTFNPTIIGKNIVDLISLSVAAKDINFQLNGFIKVKSGFLTATLPFQYQNNLKSILNK